MPAYDQRKFFRPAAQPCDHCKGIKETANESGASVQTATEMRGAADAYMLKLNK